MYEILLAKDVRVQVLRRHAKEIRTLLYELTQNKKYLRSDDRLLTPFFKTRRHSFLFLVRDTEMGCFVGMATLVPLWSPTGLKGNVEDVVVSPDHKGKKLGLRLMQELIVTAKRQLVSFLALTSNAKNPKRASAQKLYLDLGFRIEREQWRLHLHSHRR